MRSLAFFLDGSSGHRLAIRTVESSSRARTNLLRLITFTTCRRIMSVESKALRPCNTAPDTPPHCDSPQAPAVTPGLPHSDPITAISLAELLKDVVKAVQATANTSKANNPHSTESEAVDLSCAPGFKTVDEVYLGPEGVPVHYRGISK